MAGVVDARSALVLGGSSPILKLLVGRHIVPRTSGWWGTIAFHDFPFVDTFPVWTEVPVNRWIMILMVCCIMFYYAYLLFITSARICNLNPADMILTLHSPASLPA